MTIEERLENMERELGCQKRCNRWLLGAILLLIGGLVTAGVFKTTVTPVQAQGAGAVKEIRANKFVLEDDNGKPRAGLSVGKDGLSLLLLDENGNPRAGLAARKEGPNLSLSDENSKPRVMLLVSKDGPSLVLYDKNGTTRFKAGKTWTVSPDGKTIEYPESSLILFGPAGKVIWSATK